jgi:hypothetical protein
VSLFPRLIFKNFIWCNIKNVQKFQKILKMIRKKIKLNY